MSFVKSRPDGPAGFFEVEAAGLRWLAVPGGVPVAEPLDVSPDRLTTTRLDTCPPTEAAAEEFGRRLAVTHAAGARHFGVPPDGWRDRIGLHQLHPLLVHVVLFGGGYVSQAVELARRY